MEPTNNPATATTETTSPVTTTATSEPSAQQAARNAVQEKYSALYEPTTSTATATESASTEAATTVESTEPTTPTREEVLTQALTAVVDRLAALEAKLVPAPVETKPTVTAEPDKAPIEYLKAGDIDGFEKALIARVQAAVGPQLTQKSTDEAVARVRAEGEVNKFIEDVRSKNPDLEPMNGWIVAEAQRLIEAQKDKIKDLNSYVEIYKDSVNKAVDTVRKAAQIIRGSGKSEGMTIRKEVIASGVMSPASPGADQTKEQEKAPESNLDYIARRQAGHGVSRGLI